jgi:hypothetical protein
VLRTAAVPVGANLACSELRYPFRGYEKGQLVVGNYFEVEHVRMYVFPSAAAAAAISNCNAAAFSGFVVCGCSML